MNNVRKMFLLAAKDLRSETRAKEIAALDEAHATGSVEEDDYAAQRAELKNRLLSLTTTDSSPGSAPSGARGSGPAGSGATPDP